MKRTIPILILLAISLYIFGCGGSTSNSTAPTTPTAVSAAAPSSLQDNAKESPKPQMKVVKESSKKIKEKRAIAEKNILAIYKLLEKSRINEAQYWFKHNRDFLNRYSYPEVVDVLEQTLIQSATAPPVAR